MATNTMGPIRCASDAAAAFAAAEIMAAMPEAEVTIDGSALMVIWTDDPDLSETVAAVTRPFAAPI
jgi:hypothetical protein